MAAMLAVSVVGIVPAQAQSLAPPNIVLVLTDDQKADWSTGNPFLTTSGTEYMPSTKDFFERNGVLYRNAFIPNSLCCPSRASILSGQYSHTNGVWGNGGDHGGFSAFRPLERYALPTWIDDTYQTGLFGKYLNHYGTTAPKHVPPGWDRWFAFSKRMGYYEWVFSDGKADTEVTYAYADGTWAGTRLTDEVVEFITSAGEEPFFAYVAPYLPHDGEGPMRTGHGPVPKHGDENLFADEPGYRPPSYNEADVSDKPAWVRKRPKWDAEKRARADEHRLNQYRVLWGWDQEFARIVQAVTDAGKADNTVFIYLSDNGYMWGEHRFREKNKPYDASVRVPFAVACGTAVDCGTFAQLPPETMVANIDVAPTIAGLAGVAPTMPVDGLDLTAGVPTRSRLVIEHQDGGAAPAFCGVRLANEVFVRYATGEEEYYDYRLDPWEEQNSAYRNRFEDRVQHLRSVTKRRCYPEPPGFDWRRRVRIPWFASRGRSNDPMA